MTCTRRPQSCLINLIQCIRKSQTFELVLNSRIGNAWSRDYEKVRPHVKRDPSDHTIYDDIIIEQPHNELQSVPEDTDTIESLPHKELQLNIPLLNHSEIDDLTLRDDDEVSEQVLEEGGQTQAAEEGGQTPSGRGRRTNPSDRVKADKPKRPRKADKPKRPRKQTVVRRTILNPPFSIAFRPRP